MRKNISSLLQKGNLTPKERYLLLIQNIIEEKNKGKKILTEADKKGLESWQAKTSEEAREWNKYNEGWKLSRRAGIETEFVYANTKAEHFRKNIIGTELAIYPFYREHLNAIKALKRIKVVDINEAVAITKKQREQKLKDGIDFDYAIYQLAFESLSDEIRKDILILDPEAEYESSYLDDEETIANLIDKKGELTKENKEKYAELVADRSYNEFAKEYQLHGSFASLPIMDIAKKWAKEKGIKPRQKDYEWLEKIKGRTEKRGIKMKEIYGEKKSDEDWLLEENLREILEDYTRDNKTTIKEILKETCLKWFDEGIPYPPIAISEGKETYSEDTKLPHNEIFKEWLKAKKKAKETLQKLIDKGELKVRERTAGETRQDTFISELKEQELHKRVLGKQYASNKIITGESLYSSFNKDNYEFIKDFKERADEYNANLGLVYADDDPEHKGDNLDREFLIADKNKLGELKIFSIFGITTQRLKTIFEATQFIKETKKDGEVILDFNNEKIKKIFKDIRESLIDGYAKLLAFEEMFKRLSKIYEIDLAFLISKRLKDVGNFIDQHNDALSTATGQKLHGGEDNVKMESWFIEPKEVLKMKDDLFIDKDKILPDIETKELWTQKFSDIFTEF